MTAEGKNPDRHITPHHAWAYLHAYDNAEFTPAEHDHIVDCEHCLHIFILCLKSETFGAVLKALGKEFDERRSA